MGRWGDEGMRGWGDEAVFSFLIILTFLIIPISFPIILTFIIPIA